jgi:hypothetical protein
MTHSTLRRALPILLAFAAGCTTMGTGVGSSPTGATTVNFNWKSTDSISGTMNAVLAGGKTYSGPFFQITTDTTVDSLGPLWSGWGRGFRGRGMWDDWAGEPDFVTHYSGKVVANLGAPNGEHMRCKFRLIQPSDGMAGGGEGQCQMPDGKTIDATFPVA